MVGSQFHIVDVSHCPVVKHIIPFGGDCKPVEGLEFLAEWDIESPGKPACLLLGDLYVGLPELLVIPIATW